MVSASGSALSTSTIDVPVNYLDLNQGLVGWWTFDGKYTSSTSTLDTSGDGYTGTLENSPSPAIGKVGQALHFEAANASSVSIAGSTEFAQTGQPFTVSAWVKLDSYSDDGNDAPTILNLETNTANAWSLLLSNVSGFQGISIGSADTWATLQSSINPNLFIGSWHLVTVSYNGQGAGTAGNFAVYLDGAPEPMTAASSGYAGVGQLNDIGTAGNRSATFFDGSIDDVRIYDRALSAAEAEQLYDATAGSHVNVSQSGPANLSQGLVGWWTFDGKYTTSTTTLDTSGSGDTGTIESSPVPTIGKVGQALQFNGSTDYVYIPGYLNIPGNTATLSFWFKSASATPTNETIFVKNDGQGGDSNGCDLDCDFEVIISSQGVGQLDLYMKSSNIGDNRSGTIIDDTNWHFYTVVWNGDTVTFYKDGQFFSVSSGNGTADDPNDNNGNELGGDNLEANAAGALDDFRVYSRALSAAEVSQLYATESGWSI